MNQMDAKVVLGTLGSLGTTGTECRCGLFGELISGSWHFLWLDFGRNYTH